MESNQVGLSNIACSTLHSTSITAPSFIWVLTRIIKNMASVSD